VFTGQRSNSIFAISGENLVRGSWGSPLVRASGRVMHGSRVWCVARKVRLHLNLADHFGDSRNALIGTYGRSRPRASDRHTCARHAQPSTT